MANNAQGVMRGLSLFIGDIRNCQTKDQEEKTVYKEMAKIRSKFQTNRGMSGYDKKKYVWKLIYMYILGYDVDFGHEESLNLINAVKFSEKCTGYIATGIMLNERNDQKLFDRVINAIKVDLTCGNEVCESLALATIGNIGSMELANDLGDIVIQKAFNEQRSCPVYVRKRACLTLLSFFKRNRSIFNQETWAGGFRQLLSNQNYGLLMSTCALMQGSISIMGRDGFQDLVPQLIKILTNINLHSQDYFYYMTPCPWLQIKILKLLQLFPPPEDQTNLTRINEILMEIVNKTEVTKNVNKNNSDHSILFEAINLIIHYRDSAFEVLRKDIVALLGKFISVKEPNIRYLALDTMSKISGPQLNLHGQSLIKQHLQTILVSLKDPDISIRRRALDLMFCLCDQQMAGEVVNELLDYLQENDYELKEEMVLKIAILAEKFAENLNWYIDVIIKLIEYAGDYVSEDIWFRVAQIVTGFGTAEPNYTLQRYAAIKLFDNLQLPSLHETMIKIGAYCLSEFGYLIQDMPGKSTPKQFEIIHRHFFNISPQGRGMLLTAYMKMIRTCPALKQTIVPIFQSYQDYWDEDIQQRVCEYLAMIQKAESDPQAQQLFLDALDKMPNFNDSLQTNSILTRRIMKLKVDKGFNINQEEVQQNITHAVKQYETNVSSALSTNQPSSLAGMNLDIGDDLLQIDTSSTKPKPQQQKEQKYQSKQPVAATQEINLLDLDIGSSGSSSQQPLDLIGSLADMTSMLPPSLGEQFEIKNHKFYYAHADRFSPQQTVKLGPQTFEMKTCSNGTQWKNLLPFSAKEGSIYSDHNIDVTVQIQTMKFLQRLLLSFKSKTSSENIRDIQIKINSQAFADSLDIQSSPPRYQSDQPPQAIVMAMLKDSISTSPHLKMSFVTPQGEACQVDFRLPIFINKSCEPLDMPIETFQKGWDDYTHNKPSSYQKIDCVIKNPAPLNVPHTEVLKKVANFFANSINLKVYPPEDPNNFWQVKAVGQINFKPPSQVGFPSNPNEVQKPLLALVMMEAEFFKEDFSEFKLSMRSNDTKQIANHLINFLKFYIQPQ